MEDSPSCQRHDRTALVLYGSETGNAQDVAEELGRTAERLHFRTWVREMDLVEITHVLKFTVVIFAISTTGQGEFPKNARRFWKSLLRKRLPPGCLGHVSFTTFGLGDSSYPKFNWAARKLHKRLEQLGAKEIYPRGEADEQHPDGIDGTYLSWWLDFQKNLLSSYPLPDGVSPIPEGVLLPPKRVLRLLDHNEVPPSVTDLRETPGGEEFTSMALSSVNATDEEFLSSFLKRFPDDSKEALKDLDALRNGVNIGKPDGEGTTTALFTPALPPSQDNISREQESVATLIHLNNNAHGQDIPVSEQVSSPTKSSTAGILLQHISSPSDTLASAPSDSSSSILPTEHYHETAKVDKSPTMNQLGTDKYVAAGFTDVQLISNKRLTPANHFQDVREVSFLLPRGITYEPGDTITILPRNSSEDVQALIDAQDWGKIADINVYMVTRHEGATGGDQSWFLDPIGLPPPPRNSPTTLRAILTAELDFNGVPNRYFFEQIANYCNDEEHSERLLELAIDHEHRDELYDYTTRPRRSMLEVLQDFETVKIPFEHVLDVFPGMRGREFSIASGGIKKDSIPAGHRRLDLLIALVEYRTILKKPRQGLCSRYIASLQPGTVINVKLSRNHMFYQHIKSNPELPVIMVACGTGLAPCRALIWERAEYAWRTTVSPKTYPCLTTLIFGGRNRSADYYYSHEWNDTFIVISTPVETAFSRDQKEKIYVQDKIRTMTIRGKELREVIVEMGAVIYVCGSSGKMPKAVREAFVDVLARDGVGVEEAQEYLNTMDKTGRYIQEVW